MKLFKPLAPVLASAFLLSGPGAASAAITYAAVAVPFGFTDISATGSVLGGLTGTDDAALSVALPFTFNFYGDSYNSLFVSSNGLLTFGSGNTQFTNADLTTSPAQAAIAPFWDDLHMAGGTPTSNAFVQTIGAPGSQQFIIQWNNVRFFAGGTAGDTLTFQAILFEGSNDIRFNYLDLVSGNAAGNNGGSATVGIKDAGTQGPDRLLLAFNNGPNAFVGTGQSTLIIATSTVPEPHVAALLLTALAGLGLARRRSA